MPEPIPNIFTPDNEPYLGRATVFAFDNTISFSLWVNRSIAEYTHRPLNPLTDLQTAASQIIPQGVNLALSIRELVRQAYLFAALVLVRPLIERAAIISYLCAHPEALAAWRSGWQFRERPSLATMLQTMAGDVDIETTKKICEHYGHIIHGDPIGAEWDKVPLDDSRFGYSVGKMLNNADLCDEICIYGWSMLTVLTGRAISCFPEVKPPERPDAVG